MQPDQKLPCWLETFRTAGRPPSIEDWGRPTGSFHFILVVLWYTGTLTLKQSRGCSGTGLPKAGALPWRL